MDRNPCPLPTPAELELHPELGLLSLLQASIDLAIRSLVAAHPELSDWDCPPWDPPSYATVLARCLVRQLDLLSELLPDYHTAATAEDHPGHRPATTPDADPF